VSLRFRALVVHSEPKALQQLVDMLASPRLKVESADAFTPALNMIREREYQLLLTEHAPPDLDGIKLMIVSQTYSAEAMRIVMMPDEAEPEQVDNNSTLINPIIRYTGGIDEHNRLRGLVYQALQMLELVQEQKDLVAKLSGDRDKLKRRETLLDAVVHERTFELEESYKKLKAANRQALFGLAEAIETKDPYTKGHCGRVAAYAMVLAEASGYPAQDLETLEFGAFLHDIGKIGIRDAVLLKPGPLDEDEWTHMREHPLMGYEIASKIEMLKTIIPAVRNHHERWDGKGYPDKLKGMQIPIAARIVAIADAYDAMATDRPYKHGLPLDDCEKLLRKNAGKMFDTSLVDIFCKNHLGAIYDERYDDEEYEDGYGDAPATPLPATPASATPAPATPAPALNERNAAFEEDESEEIDMDDFAAGV
jgi:putative nucleotidyltransferase with HDIG domain